MKHFKYFIIDRDIIQKFSFVNYRLAFIASRTFQAKRWENIHRTKYTS